MGLRWFILLINIEFLKMYYSFLNKTGDHHIDKNYRTFQELELLMKFQGKSQQTNIFKSEQIKIFIYWQLL